MILKLDNVNVIKAILGTLVNLNFVKIIVTIKENVIITQDYVNVLKVLQVQAV